MQAGQNHEACAIDDIFVARLYLLARTLVYNHPVWCRRQHSTRTWRKQTSKIELNSLFKANKPDNRNWLRSMMIHGFGNLKTALTDYSYEKETVCIIRKLGRFLISFGLFASTSDRYAGLTTVAIDSLWANPTSWCNIAFNVIYSFLSFLGNTRTLLFIYLTNRHLKVVYFQIKYVRFPINSKIFSFERYSRNVFWTVMNVEHVVILHSQYEKRFLWV